VHVQTYVITLNEDPGAGPSGVRISERQVQGRVPYWAGAIRLQGCRPLVTIAMVILLVTLAEWVLAVMSACRSPSTHTPAHL
jgi:hypothetical protein